MGKVFNSLIEKRKNKVLMFALLDPDKFSPDKARQLVSRKDIGFFDAFLVGGSTAIWQDRVDLLIKAIKEKTEKPVIIFPNSINNLSPYADAVLFLSLLNSSNTFYVIDQQFQAAPIIRKMGLETISTAYIIVGDGGTAGYVGHARPIPYDKPELAEAYALAAEYLGFKLIYLEGGSGAGMPIRLEIVKRVKRVVNVPLIVGGGIRDWMYIKSLEEVGVDGVVIGNLLEDESSLKDFISQRLLTESLAEQ
ncbi:MAG: geranylgeranylglyceryl/heptaprenylglyceryl phosphate synthase [Thermoprotei archaeon]